VEILWLACEHRYSAQSGRQARLVWVAGESAYFPEEVTGTVAEVIKAAIDAGVVIAFVFRSPTVACDNLDEFVTRNRIGPDKAPSKADRPRRSPVQRSTWVVGFPEPHVAAPLFRGFEPNYDNCLQHGPIAL
jgi:hypothetical protein